MKIILWSRVVVFVAIVLDRVSYGSATTSQLTTTFCEAKDKECLGGDVESKFTPTARLCRILCSGQLEFECQSVFYENRICYLKSKRCSASELVVSVGGLDLYALREGESCPADRPIFNSTTDKVYSQRFCRIANKVCRGNDLYSNPQNIISDILCMKKCTNILECAGFDFDGRCSPKEKACSYNELTDANGTNSYIRLEQGQEICPDNSEPWPTEASTVISTVPPTTPPTRPPATTASEIEEINSQTITAGIVFRVNGGVHYQYTSKDGATAACTQSGAQLATSNQLLEAWVRGYDQCSCGWLTDGTAKLYEIMRAQPRTGCGTPMRINDCPPTFKGQWGGRGWGAYCYKPFRKSFEPITQKTIIDGKVFHLRAGRKYEMTSMEIAAAFCTNVGAHLASPTQLMEAWQSGFDNCACGWLTSGTAKFPIREQQRPGCGDAMTLNDCPNAQMGKWGGPGWDAYCFKSELGFSSQSITNGFVFHLRARRMYALRSRESAASFCTNVGAQLASPEQLMEAWQSGLDNCACGWLTYGTAKSPIREQQRPGCGAAMTLNDCPNAQIGSWRGPGWDAYCFKPELSILSQTITNGLVFRVNGGVYYQYTSKDGATAACTQSGAQLATSNQLLEAWVRGYDQCFCGWLTDGTAKFPIREHQRAGCGTPMTINDCPSTNMGRWGGPGWDAYCYKPSRSGFEPTIEKNITGGKVFHLRAGRKYEMTSMEIAAAFCTNVGAQLASPEQLMEAWQSGFDNCACGWLTYGTAKSPIREQQRPGCGAAMTLNDCPNAQMGSWGGPGWDAYCFKPVSGNARPGESVVITVNG